MKIVLLCLLLISQMMGYSLFESDKTINQRHLNLINAIKDTVITTQKTRGLTNNYMNGNVVAQLLVYGQRKSMIENFSTIEKSFAELELSTRFYQDAQKLMQKSKALNKQAFKRDSGEVFASYSGVIEAWIGLNKDIIEERYSKQDPEMYADTKILNNVLLPLTENIGKMRGMGSGIVARRYCKENEIVKMQGFLKEIKHYRELLQRYMSVTAYDVLGQKEIRRIVQNIEEYAELTGEKVIGKKDIDLVTNEYFDQGTAAIADVLKVYNAIMATLQGL